MITYNNWMTNNADRIKNGERFKVSLDLFPFKRKSFHESADWVATDISHKYGNIYVSLSGGQDSEYIVRCFKRNKISFIPIIGKCNGSSIDTDYADEICESIGIKPIILFVNDSEILQIFNELCQTRIIAREAILRTATSKYVTAKNGLLITGHHIMCDTPEIEGEEEMFDVRDHDNVFDAMNMHNYVPFYNYHPSLAYSMVEHFDKKFILNDEYKSSLYNLSKRDKKRINYSPGIVNMFNMIRKKYNLKEKQYHFFGNKQECMKLFEDFVII